MECTLKEVQDLSGAGITAMIVGQVQHISVDEILIGQIIMNLQEKKIMENIILLDNIDKLHTTEMGINRIKKNLKVDTDDVVEYCKNKVLDKNCKIYRQGKNWYCEVDNVKITINAYSYTIITAHIVK